MSGSTITATSTWLFIMCFSTKAWIFFYDRIGVGEEYTRSGVGSVFTLEVHLQYLQELNLHDRVRVHLQLLDFDEKRLHFFEYMYHAENGYLADHFGTDGYPR